MLRSLLLLGSLGSEARPLCGAVLRGSRIRRGPLLRVGLTRSCAHIPFLSYMCLVVPVEMPRGHFLPFFSELVMHRRPEQKRSSVAKFKSRVGKTDSVNTQRNRRGGIRL